MIFFKYTQYLEQQVKELKEEKREMQVRVDKLTNALVPILRHMNLKELSKDTAEPEKTPKVIHNVDTSKEGIVKCSCGWIAQSDDPAQLQEEVSNHVRKFQTSIQGGRQGWVAAKKKLENQKEGETK